jgi:hypothetical protein
MPSPENFNPQEVAKAVSSPHRVNILKILGERESSATEVAKKLDITPEISPKVHLQYSLRRSTIRPI